MALADDAIGDRKNLLGRRRHGRISKTLVELSIDCHQMSGQTLFKRLLRMAKGKSMKIIEMAKDIKPGEKILDTGTSFVVKEIRVHLEHGLIAFLDTEDVGHGYYHPNEYLGVGAELSRMPQLTIGIRQQSLPR